MMMNGATLAGTGSEIPPPDLPWKSRLDTNNLRFTIYDNDDVA
jgi:hypothetical protein